MATSTLLAIPTLDGRVPHQALGLVARIVIEGNHCLTVPGASPREWAKNLCVKAFLKESHDRLLICDGDMVPTYAAWTAVQDLMDEGYDMAVARCLIGKKSEDKQSYVPMPAIYELVDGQYESIDITAPGEVDGIGGAFTCYSRQLLSDKRLHLDDGGAVFRNVLWPDGKTKWSEDLDFCYRARELGYHFAATPEKVGHMKMLNLDLMENSIGPEPG